MSAPLLAVTAFGLPFKKKKIKKNGSPAMSAPSLAATADGELENDNYSLAGDVYALIGCDRRWRAGK